PMRCLCGLLAVMWFGPSLVCGQAPEAAATPAPTSANTPAANDEPPLPKLKEMELPSVEELLHGKPTDWIVMVNQDVLIVEPVSPRPGTLEARKAEYDALQKVPVTEIDLNEKLRR